MMLMGYGFDISLWIHSSLIVRFQSYFPLSFPGDSVRVQAHGQRQRGGGGESAAQQPRLLQHSEAVLSLRGHSGGHGPNAEVGAGPGLHQVKGVQAQAAENAQTAGNIFSKLFY